MGLMNYLREKAGILIVSCIGLAIVAFLLGDVVSYGTPFWARHQNQVGSIDGNSIDIQEFNQQVEQTSAMFSQQMGGAVSPQMKAYAVEQVWSQYLNRELLQNEIEKIGFSVGSAELNELVQGASPSRLIQQSFANQQTGQFDRMELMNFVSQVGTLPDNHEAKMQWNMLLENIVNEQIATKYQNLINNSVYVTTLEANDEYVNRNRLANFDYVLLDYADAAEVTVTDADYKAYYDEHKGTFVNREETRSIEFVEFDASPVAEDTLRVANQMQELMAQLKESKTDSLFAAVNSDTKYPFAYRKKGFLSPELDSLVFSAPLGTVVGPVLSNGVFEIAKVVDSRVGPDSVKASHILLNPAMEGGIDKAKAKADSIKNLLLKGENFVSLAIQYSVDEGSKVNGGELGTFGRGMMVPVFEDAAFDNKKGDIVITTSQFGVHIIKIVDQIGSSRVVKAAVIDKFVQSGKETIDAAYNKASSFLSTANYSNFEDVAVDQGLLVEKVDRLTARETMLNGHAIKRELVRWAFETKTGTIGDKIFESENNDKYYVVRVTGVLKKGQLALNDVKNDIHDAVVSLVKAKALTQKLADASKGASSIQQIAQNVGAEVTSTENIVFGNPVIPGVSMEPKVVGGVFGLDVNKPSKPMIGNQGVYVVQVNGFVNPAALGDVRLQRNQMEQIQRQRNASSVFRALLDKADIVDNRAKFF
jgi:peptidyl-prolyl cis-trans isomerase D